MEVMNRDDLMIEFMENMDEEDLVQLYNEYAEENGYEQIYENTEDNIEVLVPTEGRTALEIWNSFSSSYREQDNYCQINGYGYLESYDDPTDNIFPSDMTNYFVTSDWYKDGFKDFLVDTLRDKGFDEVFVKWVEDDFDWDEEWEDTDDLWNIWIDEIGEGDEDDEEEETDNEEE